jgi:hypothetical protein
MKKTISILTVLACLAIIIWAGTTPSDPDPSNPLIGLISVSRVLLVLIYFTFPIWMFLLIFAAMAWIVKCIFKL